MLEVHHTNRDEDSGSSHTIDFHAVSGPGGGAPLLIAKTGETKVARFKLLEPGLYIYHCASSPVPTHVQNGMYGLLLVEPEEALRPVDREFFVVQSEFYAKKPASSSELAEPSHADGLLEQPRRVLFNGEHAALVKKPLQAKQGDRVRIYFGNAGPNLVSSFHVIGTIFDKVYRESDLISLPARGVQSTLVPSGGSVVVELDVMVPGNYTLVDHSIFRTEKGAIGILRVTGKDRPDMFGPVEQAVVT